MLKKLARLVAIPSLIGLIALVGCDDDDNDGGVNNPPAAVTNFEVTTSGDTVTLTWTPSSNATSHRAELRAAADTTTLSLSATADSAQFTGVSEGDYEAAVIAINGAGETPVTGISLHVDPDLRALTGEILQDMTLTKGLKWVLRGPVFVGRDVGADGNAANGVSVTLTVEPGATVYGDTIRPTGERGNYLVITRGSKIIADANRSLADKSQRPIPDSVIVFTSGLPRGSRSRADWGGLVINGRAPTNSGLEASGEGDSGLYGGNVPDDDSGILRGVRVEFAGDQATTTDELNGIAFQGVGAGTTVDYVQVHYNADDATEPFGGNVSQTHMVGTGIGDDTFDGTDGYQGFMQFLIGQQRGDDGDNGFEISNNGDDPAADQPPSTAVIANATLIGAAVDLGSGEITGLGSNGDIGIDFREGSHYRVYNVIITGFGDSGFDVEGAQSAVNADCRLEIGCSAAQAADPTLTLSLQGSILWSNVSAGGGADNFADGSGDGYDQAANQTFFNTAGFDNMLADPLLPDEAFSIGSQASPPNFVPTGTPGGYSAFDVSTLNNGAGLVMPTDGRTLQATAYAGAVEPGTALTDAWYYGWTVWSTDGSDSRPGIAEN
jgi:hypothetical protein